MQARDLDAEIVRLTLEGVPQKVIAHRLGIPASTVVQRVGLLRDTGRLPPRYRDWAKLDPVVLRMARDEGVPPVMIGERLGMPGNDIARRIQILRDAGHEIPPFPSGRRPGVPQLHERRMPDTYRMLEMARAGCSPAEIGEALGLSPRHVRARLSYYRGIGELGELKAAA